MEVHRNVCKAVDPNGNSWQVLISWEWDQDDWVPVDSVVEKAETLEQMAKAILEGE